jgi:hypothetical protein
MSAVGHEPLGWVEPLRNPSLEPRLDDGFASAFALTRLGRTGRSTHLADYALEPSRAEAILAGYART